ncbi:IS4 family transposase [Thalassomonas haliotis]|uniref:IS4 family transposase n=1 Tax=Thalassomonas haliotis TaxID=485448 RepID=A0ABY7V9W6_9GAMM|nr:IS4 family transposase [Thalassomonas haliotis]WDE10240.1 IS4 family transposase [Thalassomonas haliotis]WDE10378.1 IS4 family transposase [Thalassomonas haliotis]WDE11235.1 IS4 family transposase [Thalassomonas haliotis]WDE11236.1 IS4 family transposase [Thalassomonas haliotis]WDE11409.1 IS4 family transposase [Thalassomonas haliotis]
MFTENHEAWAKLLFGDADLGDLRRTKRLVKIAGDMAANVGSSVVKASADVAAIEGAYRLIRNPSIKAEDIAHAGFLKTDEIVAQRPLVLAIQDTTGLSFRHSICDELGEVTSAGKDCKSSKGRTLFAHSTLMIDAQSERILGLANQDYAYREKKMTGKAHDLQCRPPQEKKSFKWQKNIEVLANRMDSKDNVIDVCDREADIYEYLDFQLSKGHRFLVRATENRTLNNPAGKLKDALSEMVPEDYFTIEIKQKGARKARTANIGLSYRNITLKRPQKARGSKEISLNMVVCREDCTDEATENLHWILYTSEPVNSAEQARKIVRYYELRWRIEEFHKTWKSDGAQVGKLRMQSRENFKRIAVILAFVAVRFLQFQELIKDKEEAQKVPCTSCMSQLTWKLLWKKTEKNKKLPVQPPSLYWMYYAIARLGGWYDSKRTGRVGVKALWSGWINLMELVESLELLKELNDL